MEFTSQLRQVKEAFGEERTQLQSHIASLQRELEESQDERDREHRLWNESQEREKRVTDPARNASPGWEKWEKNETDAARDVRGAQRESNWDHSVELDRLQTTMAEQRTQVCSAVVRARGWSRVRTPVVPLRNLGKFVYPTLAVYFGGFPINCCPFYLVSMPREVNVPTQGVNV